MEDGRPPRALRILYAVVVVAVAGLLAPLLLPGPRCRLQAALPGALKTGGGRGI